MLFDSLDDFVTLSSKKRANLPALLDEFESDLSDYAGKEWGYNPKVFPLLRKAVRGYVAGKFSRQALEAVSHRTILCYLGNEGTEDELVEDLRCYIRTKPSIDLCEVVSQLISRSKAAEAKPEQRQGSPNKTQHRQRPPGTGMFQERTATTSTGVVLRLVK